MVVRLVRFGIGLSVDHELSEAKYNGVDHNGGELFGRFLDGQFLMWYVLMVTDGSVSKRIGY